MCTFRAISDADNGNDYYGTVWQVEDELIE
jgi:hypothetical protein